MEWEGLGFWRDPAACLVQWILHHRRKFGVTWSDTLSCWRLYHVAWLSLSTGGGVSHAPLGFGHRHIYHCVLQLYQGDGLLPGPFTSERCLGTSSDQMAYAGTFICYVLYVVRYEDFSLSWVLQKPSLVSSLLKHVAPLNQWEISSRLGALLCSCIMALLRSFGLRHMCKVSSGLLGYVKDNTHSVGHETGAIRSLLTIS